VIPEPRARPA